MGKSEAVNQRKTENVIVIRKGRNNDLQNTTQTPKIEQHEPL